MTNLYIPKLCSSVNSEMSVVFHWGYFDETDTMVFHPKLVKELARHEDVCNAVNMARIAEQKALDASIPCDADQPLEIRRQKFYESRQTGEFETNAELFNHANELRIQAENLAKQYVSDVRLLINVTDCA